MDRSSLLVVDLLVATVLELAGFPVVLEVLHLSAVLGVLVVVEGVLETALATLAQAEDQEGRDTEDTGGGGATVDSDVSSLAQVIPLVSGGLGRGLVEFGYGG